MANIHCPLCGEENKCGGNSPSGACWCTKQDFPRHIFDQVPVESLRKHCICENCLEQYKKAAAKETLS